MEKGWCWQAAERRFRGLPAPEDPTACLSPCPGTTESAGLVLDLVSMARGQLRTGFGGAYALDWMALARLADDFGVTTDDQWWQMVVVAEHELMKALTPKKKDPGDPTEE